MIGSDYLLRIYGSAFQGDAVVLTGDGLSLLGRVPVAYGGTTVTAAVPLALLGGDDGQMNFKVISQRQLTTNTSTGVLDYAPDLGVAPATVAQTVPEPGTAALLLTAAAQMTGITMLRRRREGAGCAA